MGKQRVVADPRRAEAVGSRSAPRQTNAAMITSPPAQRPKPAVHRIAIRLGTIDQLFNSMDPSPFHEQDLDRDAEEFIMSWAQEFPRREPIALAIHLDEAIKGEHTPELIERSVHHYFAYRAKLNKRELHRLWKDGRKSLLIGLTFMAACLFTAGLLPTADTHRAWSVVREGLTIAGWVAMWRPMQIYLYDWWPLRRRGQIFEKMSCMDVEVQTGTKTGKGRKSLILDAAPNRAGG